MWFGEQSMVTIFLLESLNVKFLCFSLCAILLITNIRSRFTSSRSSFELNKGENFQILFLSTLFVFGLNEYSIESVIYDCEFSDDGKIEISLIS